MKRRASGGPKKQKVQVNKATNPAPRVEVTKRTKRVKKGPQAATLVQRTLEYIASNAHVVFSRTNQKAQSGLQTVIRDVLTSWDSPRRASITGLPRLIETLFPFVTVLDLSDAHLNFSSLALCTRLVSVNLKNTSVGDAAVTSLLESNPNLQVRFSFEELSCTKIHGRFLKSFFFSIPFLIISCLISLVGFKPLLMQTAYEHRDNQSVVRSRT